ncbi:TRAP transporter large permease subunit [Breoghania sp. L-A4]|uniref:TRAP transporter large permease n=1 Tax=Breoghania sp. L-A4 TaxID=2304600 RepID=UPI000E360588|nr:TRAP transporter large permease subunit [Breoghania sp. L-A4]AXS42751.1 TRAP transporter large permease subunit [Breoghania sp. L-A4]
MDLILTSLDIAMFAVLCAALMAGFPVAFTLAGTALAFALIGWLFGAQLSLGALPSRIFGVMTNEVLIAVPLFVFMGVMLERSKVAEDLLEAMAGLFGGRRGGLAISVTLVGALLAASTGIVGATVVTMGLMSLPTMLKHGYSPRLASGAIAASGTLGQIIPPSIVLVILGDQLSNAYRRAQLDAGNFAPDSVSVGDLFAAALIPGLLLVCLYIAYLATVAVLRPQDAPALPRVVSFGAGRAARSLVPPVMLIVAVLGSILGGIATPTEAASVGAVGALLLASLRSDGTARSLWSTMPVVLSGLAAVCLLALTTLMDLRVARDAIPFADMGGIVMAVVLCAVIAWGLFVALRRVWRADVLAPVVHATARITAMIFAIVIGASIFSLVFRDLGGEELVHAMLSDLPGGTLGAVLAVMAAMFVLGFFLDFLEITFVVVPLVAPVLLKMPMPDGTLMSPVWLAVMMAVNLQTSFLTPPFGFALFYLRGVAPDSVRTSDIYRGIVPFVGIQLLVLLLLWFAPRLATWLPGVIYG